jgi:hypothetical protein
MGTAYEIRLVGADFRVGLTAELFADYLEHELSSSWSCVELEECDLLPRSKLPLAVLEWDAK